MQLQSIKLKYSSVFREINLRKKMSPNPLNVEVANSIIIFQLQQISPLSLIKCM